MNSLVVYTDWTPDLPLPFFEGLVDYLGHSMRIPVSLRVPDEGSSGPNPFVHGQADIGLLRTPSFQRWCAQGQRNLALLPVAPVFRDPRVQGEPQYFAEVVVRGSHPAQSFWDLRGCIWGYSQPSSLSGHISVLRKLGELEEDERFFRSHRCTGSHRDSLRLLRDGEVDVVAVDSNALILARRRNPDLRHELRVLESWGPMPIQPVVARADLPEEARDELVRHLCRMSSLPTGRELLDDLWMKGFVACGEEREQQLRHEVLELEPGLAALAGLAGGRNSEEQGRLSQRVRYLLNSLF